MATFTVANTLDSGAGSLRQAILDANAATEPSLIRFQIPASDPNFIDVDLGNGMDGIRIQRSNNEIGGPPGMGHKIAFNKLNGVTIVSLATGNAVLGNSIYSNAGLSIEIGDDGPTPNDADDVDEGPNRIQNTPVISEALVGPSSVRLTFSVSTAVENASYPLLVEFFLADPSDAREGKTYLGSATFLAADLEAGQKTVVFPPAAPVKAGDSIIATASDTVNLLQPANTSEFSEPTTVLINPWHNFNRPFAVNEVAGVFADDALDVINYLNEFGSTPVPVFAAGPPFYDTNGDFTVSAGDALDIINFLNAGLGGEGEDSNQLQTTNSPSAERANVAIADDLAMLLAADQIFGKTRRGRAR